MRKNSIFKRSLATITAVSCLAMTGCGTSFVSNDATKYPLVKALTTQEVKDYYKKALEYDSVVKRAADDNKAIVTYTINPVSPSKEDKLKRLVSKAEQILSQQEYTYENDNSEIISEDTWAYIKYVLDNEVLSNGSVVNIGSALGFYFVDVEYDISAVAPGSFKPYSDMLGLNGVWMETATGDYRANIGYLESTMQSLNEYFAENNIMRCAFYDQSTYLLEIIDGLDPRTYMAETTSYIDETGLLGSQNTVEETPDSTESTEEEGTEEGTGEEGTEEDGTEASDENGTENENDTSEEQQNPEEETTSEESESTPVETPNRELPTIEPGETVQSAIISYESLTDEDRRPKLDSELINEVAGSSLQSTAFLPYLDLVYEPSASYGISGLGIYPQANSGLRLYGYNRANLKGKATLRYVFKDDMNATGKFVGTNIYVMSEEISTGPDVASKTVQVPSYVEEQFEILIERMDRVQANCDLAGMMNGKIYEDKGAAVLAGFRDTGVHTAKYMSTIRQILSRDIETNTYLIEIETTVIDGPKSSDCYGTYRDKAYVVIQQQGSKFVISDYARSSRTMVDEPPINPDKAIEKRLVALNLTGDVTDTEKNACTTLMSQLYTAGTNRKLSTTEVDGEVVRGLNDCFNGNTEMLSSSELDYTSIWLQNKLIKYGANTDSVYTGRITEFIGGWDNQVEFVAEELITYAGRDEGYYMEVYYLVSCMEDVWVIDERTVLDDRDISGTELQSKREDLGQ